MGGAYGQEPGLVRQLGSGCRHGAEPVVAVGFAARWGGSTPDPDKVADRHGDAG